MDEEKKGYIRRILRAVIALDARTIAHEMAGYRELTTDEPKKSILEYPHNLYVLLQTIIEDEGNYPHVIEVYISGCCVMNLRQLRIYRKPMTHPLGAALYEEKIGFEGWLSYQHKIINVYKSSALADGLAEIVVDDEDTYTINVPLDLIPPEPPYPPGGTRVIR
jgi:hypothetical protein